MEELKIVFGFIYTIIILSYSFKAFSNPARGFSACLVFLPLEYFKLFSFFPKDIFLYKIEFCASDVIIISTLLGSLTDHRNERFYFANQKSIKILVYFFMLISFLPIVRSTHFSYSFIDYLKVVFTPLCLFYLTIKYFDPDKYSLYLKYLSISTFMFCFYPFIEHFLMLNNPFELLMVNRNETTGVVDSVFGQRNSLSITLVRILPVVIGLALIKRRVVDYGMFIFIFITLFFSFSRSGWMASFAIFILFYLFLGKSKNISILFISVLAVIIIIIITNDVILARLIEPFIANDVTFSGRTFIWIGVFNLIRENYLFGLSRMDFANDFYSLIGVDPGINIASTHNVLLDIFLFFGLFGFILFMTLTWKFMKLNFKSIKKASDNGIKIFLTALLISQVMMFVQGMVENSYFTSFRSQIFWLFNGMILCLFYYLKDRNKKSLLVQE